MHPPSIQRNSGREHRSMDRSHHGVSHESSGYRPDGRPPSGRTGSRSDRPSLPSNYDSLPPRLKKKFEEDRMLQSMASDRIPPTPVQAGHLPESEWDGTSRTFLNVTGPPVRPVLPHPFPQSTSPTAPTSIRPQHHWATGGVKLVRGGRPAAGGLSKAFSSADQDDVESLLIRPRSQDSMSGNFSDHGRERKTSATDSRSSTPSSSVVECSSGQHQLRGNFVQLSCN